MAQSHPHLRRSPSRTTLVVSTIVVAACVVIVFVILGGAAKSRAFVTAGSSGVSQRALERVASDFAKPHSTGTSSDPAPASPPTIAVHVVGAVKHPGLYLICEQCRVDAAIRAAGGFARGAEQSSVNLAQHMVDGEQIAVAARGESPPGGAQGGGTPDQPRGAAQSKAAAGSGGIAGSSDGRSAPVNLNTASQAELEALPGIGPSIAGRILEYRTSEGRFGSVEELKNVSGIGEKTYAKLKPFITVS